MQAADDFGRACFSNSFAVLSHVSIRLSRFETQCQNMQNRWILKGHMPKWAGTLEHHSFAGQPNWTQVCAGPGNCILIDPNL